MRAIFNQGRTWRRANAPIDLNHQGHMPLLPQGLTLLYLIMFSLCNKTQNEYSLGNVLWTELQ